MHVIYLYWRAYASAADPLPSDTGSLGAWESRKCGEPGSLEAWESGILGAWEPGSLEDAKQGRRRTMMMTMLTTMTTMMITITMEMVLMMRMLYLRAYASAADLLS